MSEEFKEYATFTVTAQDGSEVEMAIVDEFEFENKNYVVGALIEGDSINEEGVYIYKVKVSKEGITVEKIRNKVDYQRVTKAYMEMDEE